jgi:hypothetical protein
MSHGGLTFGGIVSDKNMKMSIMLAVFEVLLKYLQANGFTKITYKVIPHIYHIFPAEEDLYSLFVYKAKLIGRDVSSTILLKNKIDFSKGRYSCIKKAQRNGLVVLRSYNFEAFMAIEEYVLEKYHNLKPTHTYSEIQLLASRFPDNIKLFTAQRGDVILAGVIMYESKTVAHAQYIATTDEGKQLGAGDLVLDFLINEYYNDKTFFDFGISTEKHGEYLNTGLVSNKETFGARTTMYDLYEVNLIY